MSVHNSELILKTQRSRLEVLRLQYFNKKHREFRSRCFFTIRPPSPNHALTAPSIPVIQPSFNSMIRFPYVAFVSECVTWMIVVPS